MNQKTAKPDLQTKIRWSVKRRGLVGTLRLALLKPPRRLVSHVWDLVHNVDTVRIAELDELSITSKNVMHAIRYQPTPAGVFRKIISNLGIPYEEFDFIDFGSGKGRTLLLASAFPFRSITGVEFAPELHEIAQQNIHKFRGTKRCPLIRSVCEDAACYRLPSEKAVLYFNFPFHEPVMSAVMERIHEVITSSHGQVILVNYEPKPAITRILGADSLFGIMVQGPDYMVYRSVPMPAPVTNP